MFRRCKLRIFVAVAATYWDRSKGKASGSERQTFRKSVAWNYTIRWQLDTHQLQSRQLLGDEAILSIKNLIKICNSRYVALVRKQIRQLNIFGCSNNIAWYISTSNSKKWCTLADFNGFIPRTRAATSRSTRKTHDSPSGPEIRMRNSEPLTALSSERLQLNHSSSAASILHSAVYF